MVKAKKDYPKNDSTTHGAFAHLPGDGDDGAGDGAADSLEVSLGNQCAGGSEGGWGCWCGRCGGVQESNEVTMNDSRLFLTL